MGVFRSPPLVESTPVEGRMAFLHYLILDDECTYLCGFDASFSPVPYRYAPPTLLDQARHVIASGKLPPRSRVHSMAGWANLLSISGDLVSAHVAYDHEPTLAEIHSAFAALLAFETACGLHLDQLREEPSRFLNVRGALWKTLKHPPPELALPEIPTVYLHCKMGVKGGHVTAELHLHNDTDLRVDPVTVTYESARDFLRPVAIYGYEAEVAGHEIRLLSGLAPGERVILVHFEPQEARAGALLTSLEYVTEDGTRVVKPARQQRVIVEAPAMVPAEPRTSLELARLLGGEELLHEAWRFSWPGVVSDAFAFARLKEAVERERPLRIFEVSLDDPQFFEAWYLAEVKGAQRPVVVEVCAWGESRMIDVRVATARQADVVGVLAAYRRRVYELLSERFMGVRAPPSAKAVPPNQRGAPSPQLHSSLLVRHLLGKLSEPELAYALRRQSAWDRETTVDLVSEFSEAMGLAAPRSGERAFSHASTHPAADGSGEDFELLPGLLKSYRRIVAPEIGVRAAAMAALRAKAPSPGPI